MSFTNKKLRILVTGASGFVGVPLVSSLKKAGYFVRATHHKIENQNANESVRYSLDEDNNYEHLLSDIDIVVHLASRVHKQNEKNEGNLEKYKKTNATGTENLVKECVKREVKLFVFLSTIKVNGECNDYDDRHECLPFTETDVPAPKDAYAISKLDAENAIRKYCSGSLTNYVIFRPPLIYGVGVKGNFHTLLDVVNKNMPLPLGSVKNKRSILYVENLVYAITSCINRPNMANKTYLISDRDISVPDLIKNISVLLNKNLTLFPFPVKLLKLLGVIIRKKSIIDRLTDSLIIDTKLLHSDMKYNPPYSFIKGLENTVDWYLLNNKTEN